MKSSSLYFPNNNTLLDNLIPSNGATCIFIIVIITILGIVVYANRANIMSLTTILNSEDIPPYPINIVYRYIDINGRMTPFVTDRNDLTAERLKRILPLSRHREQINGV